uniref:Uncharacterized protein n=1 Tax=Stomoxys calcitrans TaxID=35570 RepID=A0A1I8P8F1_STOCA
MDLNLSNAQAHVILRRNVEISENSNQVPEVLRTPQKYIIEPVATEAIAVENLIVPPYDEVHFDDDDDNHKEVVEENKENIQSSEQVKHEAEKTEGNTEVKEQLDLKPTLLDSKGSIKLTSTESVEKTPLQTEEQPKVENSNTLAVVSADTSAHAETKVASDKTVLKDANAKIISAESNPLPSTEDLNIFIQASAPSNDHKNTLQLTAANEAPSGVSTETNIANFALRKDEKINEADKSQEKYGDKTKTKTSTAEQNLKQKSSLIKEEQNLGKNTNSPSKVAENASKTEILTASQPLTNNATPQQVKKALLKNIVNSEESPTEDYSSEKNEEIPSSFKRTLLENTEGKDLENSPKPTEEEQVKGENLLETSNQDVLGKPTTLGENEKNLKDIINEESTEETWTLGKSKADSKISAEESLDEQSVDKKHNSAIESQQTLEYKETNDQLIDEILTQEESKAQNSSNNEKSSNESSTGKNNPNSSVDENQKTSQDSLKESVNDVSPPKNAVPNEELTQTIPQLPENNIDLSETSLITSTAEESAEDTAKIGAVRTLLEINEENPPDIPENKQEDIKATPISDINEKEEKKNPKETENQEKSSEDLPTTLKKSSVNDVNFPPNEGLAKTTETSSENRKENEIPGDSKENNFEKLPELFELGEDDA